MASDKKGFVQHSAEDIDQERQKLLETCHFTAPGFAEEGCGFHVKTVRPLENDDDQNLLFHIKILTSVGIPTEDLLKNGSLDELIGILYEMQSVEEESHLCVQQVNPANPQRILQTGFTVECDEHNVFKLVQSTVTEKKRKNNQGCLIHIRVYQLKCTMMKEYSRICQYIKLLKVFNPKMEFDSTMKIHDNSCVSDFSCKYIPVIGSEIKMCSNTEYYISSDITPICPRIYPYCGDSVMLPAIDIGGGLHVNISLQAISLCISHRIDRINPHSHAFMMLFGPDKMPIYPLCSASNNYNFLTEFAWKKYLFNLYQGNKAGECCFGVGDKDLMNPQYEVCLAPTCGYPVKHSYKDQLLCILLILDLDEKWSPAVKINTLQWIRQNWFVFIKSHKELVEKVVMSTLDKTLHLQTKVSKNENLYNRAINDIAASVSSIIMRSTNEEFRENCFSLLKADSARDAEQQLKQKLWSIASSKCNISYDANTQISSIRENIKEKVEQHRELPRLPINNNSQNCHDGNHEFETIEQSCSSRVTADSIPWEDFTFESGDFFESEIQMFTGNIMQTVDVDTEHVREQDLLEFQVFKPGVFETRRSTEVFMSNQDIDTDNDQLDALRVTETLQLQPIQENSEIPALLPSEEEINSNFIVKQLYNSSDTDEEKVPSDKVSCDEMGDVVISDNYTVLDCDDQVPMISHMDGEKSSVKIDMVERDSEEWFNDVLLDVQDWLNS